MLLESPPPRLEESKPVNTSIKLAENQAERSEETLNKVEQDHEQQTPNESIHYPNNDIEILHDTPEQDDTPD